MNGSVVSDSVSMVESLKLGLEVLIALLEFLVMFW